MKPRHPRSAPLAPTLLLLLAPAAPASPQEPPPAAPCDEQLAELARLEDATERITGQLERLRGRAFERRVQIQIADAEVFISLALESSAELVPPEVLAAATRLQKMLGLLPPDVDPMALMLELLEGQVAGFYFPGNDTFYLMEGMSGPIVDMILAHELTHALDDQLFDLDLGLRERVDSSDALNAYRALVEGNGMVMMTRWVLAHPPKVSPEEMQLAMPGSDAFDRVPAAIWKPLLFAYMGGMAFLEKGRQIRRQLDGSRDMNEVLDQAFLAPPRSSQQVLHPEKYWNPELLDEPREVAHDVSRLPAGWSSTLSDTLGELYLAILVEEPAEIDFADPMALMGIRYTDPVVSGWDGDQALLLTLGAGAESEAVSDAPAQLALLAAFFEDTAGAAAFEQALGSVRARIESGLEELAGPGRASGLLIWTEGSLVRLASYTGLDAAAAEELAREIPVSVGPDPLAGPHDATLDGR